jgi:spheroidene monooxygenase
MVLARFDDLRVAEPVSQDDPSRVLFRGVGADTRAAATEPASRQAFRFTVLSLHADEASAHESVENRLIIAPWIAQAAEVWAAVLLPFRHMGECNYIDQTKPGPLFRSLGAQPAPAEPIVIVTTAGWALGPGIDMGRVSTFSSGVLGVRASMTAVEGLHSQQSFFFPGAIQHDPVTVTLWRDSASARAFAYGPGVHKAQMQRQREQNLADRTSFTRCRIARSEGTWHGRNPLAW